ncbi:MAG: hypothetical protein ACFCUE_01010 [Candidatus Bathyarchaeia archaeon]
MYKTIVIDCQNKDGVISCEDCALYHECLIRKERIVISSKQ